MKWEIADHLEQYPCSEKVFESLQHMISVRKKIIQYLLIENDLRFIDSGNSHLLVYEKKAEKWKISMYSNLPL